MKRSKVLKIIGAIAVVVLVAGGGHAAAENEEPADGVNGPFSEVHEAIAEAALRELEREGSTGRAEMSVVDYRTFTEVVEADVEHTTPLLRDDEAVVLVALDGHVDISSIRLAPVLPGAESITSPTSGRGVILAYDESGRMLSRFVLLDFADDTDVSARRDSRGAAERLADLGLHTSPVSER